MKKDLNQVSDLLLNLEGPKPLDEEEARFLQEKREKSLQKEKQTQEEISKELNTFEQEVKKLTTMPKEELEEKQKVLFEPAKFSKKRKGVFEELNVEVQVETVTQEKPKKKQLPTKKKKIVSLKDQYPDSE